MRNLLLLVFVCSLNLSAMAENNAVTDDINWPETVWEWRVSPSDTPIPNGTLVFWQEAIYEMINEAEGFCYSDGWSPTGWNSYSYRWIVAVANFEDGMSVAAGEYVATEDAIYECTTASVGWNDANFNRVAGLDRAPVDEYFQDFPANFVGFYQDDIIWHPGYVTVYEGELFVCKASTHRQGGETPAQVSWGYWSAEPLGPFDELLWWSNPPAWDDDRWWPVGAIVHYNGTYYKCTANTHAAGMEHPETNWGYWEELTGFNSIGTTKPNDLTCEVIDGFLSVNSDKASIEVYNPSGQLIGKSVSNEIRLPYRGLYIVRVNTPTETKALKVIW